MGNNDRSSNNKTNIPNLDKRRWPSIKKPFSDEIFSSWATRISLANLSSLRLLLNYYDIPKLSKDIDLYQNTRMINLFSIKTGIKKDEIKNLLLSPKRKTISNLNKTKPKRLSLGPKNWFTNVNVRNDPRILNSTRYCPKCLQSDKIPYYRKDWKFSYKTYCPTHKCFLENKCPHCGKAYSLLDLSWDSDLFHCSNCNNLLFLSSTDELIILEDNLIEIHEKYVSDFSKSNSFMFWILNFSYFLFKNFRSWNIPEMQKIQNAYPSLIQCLNWNSRFANYTKLQFLADIELNFYYTALALILLDKNILDLNLIRKFLLRYFLNQNRFQKNNSYYCPLDNCSVHYQEVDKILFHICRDISRENNPEFHCSQCKKKFYEEDELIKHEIIHTDESAYWCLKCKYPIPFSTYRAFKDHSMIHKIKKSKNIQCRTCKKLFSSDFMLKKHNIWMHSS